MRTQPMGDITQKHLPLVMLVENLLRIIPVSCNEQALPSSEESSELLSSTSILVGLALPLTAFLVTTTGAVSCKKKKKKK